MCTFYNREETNDNFTSPWAVIMAWESQGKLERGSGTSLVTINRNALVSSNYLWIHCFLNTYFNIPFFDLVPFWVTYIICLLGFSFFGLSRVQNFKKGTAWNRLCAVLSCLVMSDSFVTPWTVAYQAPLSVGILQARILQWVAMPFSRWSSQPRDRTQVSHISSRFFAIRPTREVQEYWSG